MTLYKIVTNRKNKRDLVRLLRTRMHNIDNFEIAIFYNPEAQTFIFNDTDTIQEMEYKGYVFYKIFKNTKGSINYTLSGLESEIFE